jgi:hypothetical protein
VLVPLKPLYTRKRRALRSTSANDSRTQALAVSDLRVPRDRYLVRDRRDGSVLPRGGGILVDVIVFIVGYRFRRLALDCGKKLSW